MSRQLRATGTRRKKRDLLTKEAVIEVAREMIAEMGHEAVSLRPLAARLKVTAAALYMFVEDKRDLLEAVAEAEFERNVAKYEAIKGRDPVTRLKEISRIYVSDARENPELFKLRLMFTPVIGEAVGAGVGAQRGFSLAMAAVKEAMSDGTLRRGDPFEMSMRIWAAVHGVATFVLMGAETRAGIDERLVDRVVDAMVAGLAPSSKQVK